MRKQITVVGVGALGSHVVQLVRNLDAAIIVVDFDRIEQKNLLSQFHAKAHVGKLKTEAITQTMNFLWGVPLAAKPTKLTNENVGVLLKNSSLVIDCLDNGVSRRLVQEHVRRFKFPCLHGALAANGGFGRVIWDEDFVVDDETGQGGATCEDGAHLPFIAIVSSYISWAAQEFMNNSKKVGFSISPAGAIRI